MFSFGQLHVKVYCIAGTIRFLPGACERVEDYLTTHIVGQELAVGQIVDAVCAHIDNKHDTKRTKPLVLSVHGPPGVGKTFTHTLLARALYNKDPASATACPGTACMGAKVWTPCMDPMRLPESIGSVSVPLNTSVCIAECRS